MNLTACFALLSKRGFNYCNVVLNGEGLASFTWSELRGGRGDSLELEYRDIKDELKSMEIILHRSRIVDNHKLVRYEPYVYIVPEDEATEHALKHVLDLSYDQLQIKGSDEDVVPVKTFKKSGGGFVTLPVKVADDDCACCENPAEEEAGDSQRPMTDEELEKWEVGRDLLAEINAGVDEMLAGKQVPTRVVEVSEEVHNARMATAQDQTEDTAS